MAQRTRANHLRPPWGRAGTVGGAASRAGRRFAWLWSRESLFRLGLSTILAVALWLYVTNKQQPGYLDFGQPISIKTANLGQGLIVLNQLGAVKIRYRSNNPNLYVTAYNFQAYVDLRKLGPGTHRGVPVQVTSDPGITVLRVTPKRVSVVLDRIQTKQVRVTSHLTGGHAPAGYQAGVISIAPNVVTVRGPERLLSQVAQASVTVTLRNQRTSISESVTPVLEDSQGLPVAPAGTPPLTIMPAQVHVQVPIKATASFKTVPVTVRTVGHPKTGYGLANLAAEPAEVTAEGPASILSRLTSVPTAAISLRGRGQGTFTVRATIRLPRRVSADASTVRVRVVIRPVAASSTIQVGIVPANVPATLSVRTNPAYLLVTVVGGSAQLARAARATSAVVDLAAYAAGTYSLAPVVHVPRGLTVLNVYPRTVTVTLVPRS